MPVQQADTRVARLLRHASLFLLVLTAAALGAGLVLWAAAGAGPADVAWFSAAVIGVGYALWAMGEALSHGRVGVDVIALLALVGAIAVRELLAAAVIAVMLASGRSLESWAAGRAHRDLQALLERAPRTARRYQEDTVEVVPLEAVVPGDRLLVAVSDVVPTDGTLISDAVLNESALTGEALPVSHSPGDLVRSGVTNAGAPFQMRATAAADESTYAGVIRLVSQAEASQAPFVRLADRYAVWFLVVSLAAAGGAWALAGPARAVAVLVVATPCPLILAAPVTWVSGMSAAARRGVVVKGGAVLERLAHCTTLLLDKTGTLTSGHPVVRAVITAGRSSAEEVLRMAASLDQVSSHVLAAAVTEAATRRGLPLAWPGHVQEVAGQGIQGVVEGHEVRVGKASWAGVTRKPIWAKTARRRARLDGALTVFTGVDGHPAGVLILDDPVRPDAAATIRALRQGGMKRIVMVTGDRAEVASTVGAVIGVDEVLAERTPAEKLDDVRRERRTAAVVMAGDGINDAPALALADVGVAMGARGATASSEAADAVLTVDRLSRLGEATSLARRTHRIAVQSVLAGIGMSLAAMGAAAAGLLPAVEGALLQEAIDVAVILNALRALRPPRHHVPRPATEAVLARFTTEHQTIRDVTERLRATADALGVIPAAEVIAQARQAQRLLTEHVAPHEAAEQEQLYPVIDQILGPEATAAMARAHTEIAHQIRRLGQLLDDIGDSPPDSADIADLRGLLYGLHAILRLHTTTEDENYLSLSEGPATAA
ncbi:MAG TPA: heavy metal translocating P-type ATPase [Streptosporangiaceae bacterium]|nr:heavy metal translocating P-type ATPase [Streptosporangiaceae bacterium]